MNVGEIEYTVNIETKNSVKASREVDKALGSTTKNMKSAEKGTKQLNTALKPLASSIRETFSKGNRAGIDSTTKGLSSLGSAATKLAGALGVAFSAAAFGSMIKNTINLASSTLDVAEKLGTTTEALSKMRYAVKQAGGMEAQEFDVALQRMTRRLSEAAQGGGVAKDAIEELGLSATSLAKSSPDEAFKLIMQQMSKLPDQADRVRLAFKFFDSGGVKLAQTAKQGADGLEELYDKLEQFGGVIDTDMARKAAEVNEKLGEMGAKFNGIGLTLTSEAMPAIEDFVAIFDDPALIDDLAALGSALVSLGGIAVGVAAEMGDLTSQVSHFFKWIKGDLTELEKLDRRIKDVQRSLTGTGMNTTLGGIWYSKEELEKQLEVLKKQREELLAIRKVAEGGGSESPGGNKKGEVSRTIPLGIKSAENDALTDSLRKQDEANQALIKSLKLLNETQGMSQTAATLYKMKVNGATEAQLLQASVLLESSEAYKNSDEAQKQYLSTMKSLEQEMKSLTLEGRELAQEQAVLQLGEYATREQIESVKALSGALYDAQLKKNELAARKGFFGDDVAGAITGNVSPLSGGKFDDQTERYEAEAQAEQQRYADAMERLREAKELELEVKGGYMALEQKMAQEHADRLAQIEKAKNDMMMTQAADAFGSMASNLQDYITTFGDENKELMAMMKASAIAQTIIQTYQGAQQAFTSLSSIPYVGPALGAAAAAAAVAGGMARVASIRAQGTRRHGGPVSAGSMYRVNEGGAPEIFQNNLGQQYMIPNSRGEVISNKDASGAGGGGVVINIHNAPQGTNAESSEGPDGEQMIDIWIADFTSDGRTASVVQNKFGLAAQGR